MSAQRAPLGPINRDTLLKASEDELCRWIEIGVDDYTNSEQPTRLTDQQYDDLVEALVSRFPGRREWCDAVQVAGGRTGERAGGGDLGEQKAGTDRDAQKLILSAPTTTDTHWPMTSLAKVHHNAELTAFGARAPPNSPLIIQPKLDGQSVQVVFEEPGRTRMYTRMKPRGQDISFLLQFLKLDPGTVLMSVDSYPTAIRGELILPEHRFREFQQLYEPNAVNARTLLTGAVNGAIVHSRKAEPWTERETFLFKNMVLVLYSVLYPMEQTYEAQGRLLQQWLKADRWYSDMRLSPVQLVPQVVIPSDRVPTVLTEEALGDLLTRWKAELPWYLDGLALKWFDARPELEQMIDGSWRNPRSAVAFKVREAGALGTVELVEWNVTRHNVLFPRIKLTEPLQVGNVSVTWVTGINAAFIKDNRIMPGTVLEIIHSGDVIPYVSRVESTPDVEVDAFPADRTWVWDRNYVHILQEDNQSEQPTVGPDQLRSQLEYMCRVFGLRDIGSGTLDALISHAVVTDIRSFIQLSGTDPARLTSTPHIGAKKAANLVSRLDNITRPIRDWHTDLLTDSDRLECLAKYMACCGKFGSGFGFKQSLSVLKQAYSLHVPPPWDEAWIMSNVQLFGSVRAQQLIGHWPEFVHWLEHTLSWRTPLADMQRLWVREEEKGVELVQGLDLVERSVVTVCLSGFRDKDGQLALRWSSARRDVHLITCEAMNKAVRAVVIPENAPKWLSSSKVKAAQKKGLPVLAAEQVSGWLMTVD